MSELVGVHGLSVRVCGLSESVCGLSMRAHREACKSSVVG